MDWVRLKRLYQGAAELTAAERDAYLAAACASDAEMRREVDALLEAGEAAGSFLETPPEATWDVRAAAEEGSTLGHYRLEQLLGRGGMGLVYRAVDLRLGRTVAVKILRPDVAASPEVRIRFLREAQAASALRHPNIVTVHDVGEADGRDFLVMEFVEGPSLARRLSEGPMAEAIAADCALQIASALETAHRAGILHRDLKPQNVMLEASGAVKVVDFGLAKRSHATESHVFYTQTGAVMGTAPYMSPEQAEGESTDARSDLFSFGALLYEMLSGRRAFLGSGAASTLAAVLRDHPPPLDSRYWPIIRRCLEKDPARRFSNAAEVCAALEAARGSTRPRFGAFRRLGAGVVVVAALVGAIRLARLWPQSAQPSRAVSQVTLDAGLTTDPALSRDGQLLAYASDRGSAGNLEIWVQPLDRGPARRLTSGTADHHEPAVSSDGRQICYRGEENGGGVWTVPVVGGQPRLLAAQGRRPRYSPDGKWITYWTGTPGSGDPWAPGSGRVYVLPAAGGNPRQLVPGFASARAPVWSPDGRHILFAGAKSSDPSTHDWWVVPLDDGEARPTGAARAISEAGVGAAVSTIPDPQEWRADTGKIVFAAVQHGASATSGLWEVALSPGDFRAAGPLVRITTGSGQEDHPSEAGGRLAFAGLTPRWSIASLEGAGTGSLSEGSVARFTPSLAGDLLVYLVADAIMARDLRTGRETTIQRQTGCNWARVSADGSQVFYTVYERDSLALFSIPTKGGTPARHLSLDERAWDISADGRRLLSMSAGTPRGVLLTDVATGQRGTLLSHSNWNLYWAAFSADRLWVAFTAKSRPETSQVYVAPLRDDGARPIPFEDWIAVTDGASIDSAPRWSADGRRVYYFSDRDGFRCIWSAGFEGGRAAAPAAVRHFHEARHSLAGIPVARLEMAVGPAGHLAFVMGELTGNIWLGQ